MRKSRAKPRVERIRDALQYLQHASESKMKTFGWKSCDIHAKLISSVILFTTFPGPTSEQRRSSGSSQSFLFLGGGQSCPYIHGEAIQHKCIESFFMEEYSRYCNVDIGKGMCIVIICTLMLIKTKFAFVLDTISSMKILNLVLFKVMDGHGGHFAADWVKDHLLEVGRHFG